MFQKQRSHSKVRSSLIKINEALIKPLTRLQYPIMVLTFLWYVISKQPGHVLKKKKRQEQPDWNDLLSAFMMETKIPQSSSEMWSFGTT